MCQLSAVHATEKLEKAISTCEKNQFNVRTSKQAHLARPPARPQVGELISNLSHHDEKQ